MVAMLIGTALSFSYEIVSIKITTQPTLSRASNQNNPSPYPMYKPLIDWMEKRKLLFSRFKAFCSERDLWGCSFSIVLKLSVC